MTHKAIPIGDFKDFNGGKFVVSDRPGVGEGQAYGILTIFKDHDKFHLSFEPNKEVGGLYPWVGELTLLDRYGARTTYSYQNEACGNHEVFVTGLGCLKVVIIEANGNRGTACPVQFWIKVEH